MNTGQHHMAKIAPDPLLSLIQKRPWILIETMLKRRCIELPKIAALLDFYLSGKHHLAQ